MTFSTQFGWNSNAGVYFLVVESAKYDATFKFLFENCCDFETVDEFDGGTHIFISYMPRKLLAYHVSRFGLTEFPHDLSVSDEDWVVQHAQGWAEYHAAQNEAMTDDCFVGLFREQPSESSPFYGLSDAKSIKSAYRELSKVHHPDCGGNAADFCRLNEQFKQAMQSLG